MYVAIHYISNAQRKFEFHISENVLENLKFPSLSDSSCLLYRKCVGRFEISLYF